MANHVIRRAVGYAGLWATLVCHGWGQPAKSSRPAATRSPAAISGTVLDPSDALIAGASVTLGAAGRDLSGTNTDAKGEFRFDAVAPGDYELRVGYPGFKTQRARLNVGARGSSPVRIVLEIADLEDSLTVASSEGRVNLEPDENLDVVRLDPRQLENLPIIDGDVIGALSRMLDPSSTGSGGPSVIVDGLPSSERGIPISEIEEVRINKNPYSAEFARPGRGRIEIITKSGSSKHHGSLNFGLRDYHLDARNAFAIERPPQERRQLDANLSGPLHKGKKNTFSLTFSRKQDSLESIVYALGLTGPIRGNAPQDQTSSFFSAQFTRRIDKNALSFRYSDYDWSQQGKGAGGFVLPDVASNSVIRYHQLYSSYRAVLSASLVNEFFVRVRTEDTATRSRLPGVPKIVVLDALTTGGAQVDTSDTDNRLEFTDIVSWSRGRHLLKTGVNIPAFGRVGVSDRSNFDGTFYFSSLDNYAHGRPFSFMRQAGDGHIAYWPKQTGAFVQDEIRLRRNLSLALGLRYEWQNYVADYNNFAPRLSFAFAPGNTQKTVFRGGAGFFYDTAPAEAIADTLRLDGSRLRQILLLDPNYPDPLSAANPITALPSSIVRFSPTLRSPYTFQYSFGVERQLQKSLTLTATYVATRGVKLFRSRDVNAPLPPFYLSRPDLSLGVLRQIESSGGLKSRGIDIGLRGDLSRFFTGAIIYEQRRAVNDTDGIGSFPANNWDLRGEWSRASFNTSHFVYLYGTLSAGTFFKFGLIFSANSGRPYSMTTGRDDNRDGVARDRPPGVPRNSLQGTGGATLDMRWSRDFPLHADRKEGLRLATSVDAFNLFNRVNYTSFVGNLSSPFFGQPVTAAPARRLQISVAVKF
jgi:outer membrane receptor protein involved in Fe transport